MPPRKRKTTINDHFSPSNKYSTRTNPRRGLAVRPVYHQGSDSGSEGSEGLANIKLAQPPSLVHDNRDRKEDGPCIGGVGEPEKLRRSQRPSLKREQVRYKDNARRRVPVQMRQDLAEVTDEEITIAPDSNPGLTRGESPESVLSRPPAGSFAVSSAIKATAPRRRARAKESGVESRSSLNDRGSHLAVTAGSNLKSSAQQRQMNPSLVPYIDIVSRHSQGHNRKESDQGADDLPLPSAQSDVIDVRSDSDHEFLATPRTSEAGPARQKRQSKPRLPSTPSSEDDILPHPTRHKPLSVKKAGPRQPRNIKHTSSERASGHVNTTQAPSSPSSSVDHDSAKNEDIQLDEPERFETVTRLRRKKESDFQRKLRKLKSKRLGVEEVSSSDDSEPDKQTAHSEDSTDDDSEEDFIEEDGGQAGDVVLPHQFSLDSAQSPEFKFKVVFHYLVMLNVHGPGLLPLRGDKRDYYQPHLEYLRRMMTGYRDARVRSQIWRSDFVKALQTYPDFEVTYLSASHTGCDACNMTGRISHYEVTLEGSPYDPDTHEIEVSSSSDEDRSFDRNSRKNKRKDKSPTSDGASTGDSDDSASSNKLTRKYFMGRFCKARAQVYHQMCHWEDDLYCRIRDYYKELLRALDRPLPSDSELSSSELDSEESDHERERRRKRRDLKRTETSNRVAQLKRTQLPPYNDVGKITEWMDLQMGYQAKEFRWFNDIVVRSERLESDKRADE